MSSELSNDAYVLTERDPKLQSEQAVLGAIIRDGNAFHDLPPRLTASDFALNQHRVVFEACKALAETKTPIDIVTLGRYLIDQKLMARAGGAAYVSSLTHQAPTSAHAAAYAQAVLDVADRRKLRWRLAEAAKAASDESVSINDTKARVEQIMSLDDADDEPIEDERDVIKRVLSRVEKAGDGEITVRGIRTGIPVVDEGFFVNPTDLIVLGGRPGHGKSVMASQIADHVGRSGPVLFISLEMRSDEIVTRRIMDRGSLTIDDVRNPRTNDAAERLVKACEQIYRETRVRYFRCRELPTILRAATRMKRREGLKLLVIDYLQRLNLWGLPGENRDQQIGAATERLKNWADDNECPVLLLSQLSRPPKIPRASTKARPAPFPTLNDLRESGNIEADANGVLLLHIPGLIDGTPEAKAKDKRTAYLIGAKQRSGEGNVVFPLRAVFEHARFAEPPPPEEESQAESEAAKRDTKAKSKPKQQRMDLPAEPAPGDDDGDH